MRYLPSLIILFFFAAAAVIDGRSIGNVPGVSTGVEVA